LVDMETKLRIFSEMMMSVWNVFFWHYDSEDRLVDSTCLEDQLFDSLFTIGGSKQRILDACTYSKKASMVADSTGFVWIAAPY